MPGERVGARPEGWQAEGGARAGAPCCTAPNNALEPTPTASARTSLRLLARLTAGVDMTSTVKYHDDARIWRAVGSLGPALDFVDAGVIGSGTMGLCGGIPR